MIFHLIFILINSTKCDQLLQVHAIWRHGARYPGNCNWKCEELKPYFGQLTSVGIRQQYNLGAWIRQRYVDTGFLQSQFTETEMQVQSTDYNRTLMSAYSNLLGMYPYGTAAQVPDIQDSFLLPPQKNIQTPDIFQGSEAIPHDVQLIPVHTNEVENDYVLHGSSSPTCPIAHQFYLDNIRTDLWNKLIKSAKVQKLFADFKEQVRPEEEVTVGLITDYTDTFYSAEYNNFGLPPTLTPKLFEELKEFSAPRFQLENHIDFYQVKLLSAGFVEKVLKSMQTAVQQTSTYRYYGYSSHDTNIQVILSAFNLTSAECIVQAYLNEKVINPSCVYTYPNYASNIIIELYNTTENKQYVKLLHNGTYVSICSNGQYSCSYQHFHDIMTNQLIIDYKNQCWPGRNQIEYETPAWAIVFMIILIILIFITAGITCYLFKYRKQSFNKLSQTA